MPADRKLSELSKKALSILQNSPLSVEILQLAAKTSKRASEFTPTQHAPAAQLNLQRLAASTTLSVNQDKIALHAWTEANYMLNDFIMSETDLNLEALLKLHKALLPAVGGAIRQTDLQGGNSKYPPYKDLQHLWEIFDSLILHNQAVTDPILFAAQIYQWLISLHFFDDANGRLARLSADWVLTSAGIPPISFDNDAASFVSVLDEVRKYDINTAVIRICQGINGSLDILEQKS